MRGTLDQSSSIASTSSSLLSSSKRSIFLTLFGDTSRATANSCADLTLSPSSRYALASWKTTLDSSGDRSLKNSKSWTASWTWVSVWMYLKTKTPYLVLFHSNEKLPPPVAYESVFRAIFDRLSVELDGSLVISSTLLRLVQNKKRRPTQTTKTGLPNQCILSRWRSLGGFRPPCDNGTPPSVLCSSSDNMYPTRT